LNILPCGHQFQVFHSSLIWTKHQVFYYTNLMIFVLLLYFCIDHIDPYFICRTVQNLNKDNLRTYIIGGRGIKSVPKLTSYYFWDVWYHFSCIWKILPPLPPSPPHNVIIWALPWQLLNCDNSFHLPRSLNNISVMLLLLFLIRWAIRWRKKSITINLSSLKNIHNNCFYNCNQP